MFRSAFVSATAIALALLVAARVQASGTPWPDDIQARLQAAAGAHAGVAAMVLSQGRIVGHGLQHPVEVPAGLALALVVLERSPAGTPRDQSGLRRQLAAALHDDVHGGTWPLCARAGGPQAVERDLQDLGIDGVRVLGTGCARVRATPLALLTLLQRVAHGPALRLPARTWLATQLERSAAAGGVQAAGWWLRADLAGRRSGMGVVRLPDGRRMALVISTDLRQPRRFARTLQTLWRAGLEPAQRLAVADPR